MFSLLKSIFNATNKTPKVKPSTITIDTLQSDIQDQLKENNNYADYMLSAEQLFELLEIINEPIVTASTSNTKQSYFDTDGYLNKVDAYNDKIDDILNDISDLSDIAKIKSKINILQSTLTKFKEFLYSRGEFGEQEYLSGHEHDFNDTREQLKDILLTDYPLNRSSK